MTGRRTPWRKRVTPAGKRRACKNWRWKAGGKIKNTGGRRLFSSRTWNGWGNEYYNDGLVDDTGRKPALADLMLEQGDPVSAAKIKRNMLDIRFGLFREKHNCK